MTQTLTRSVASGETSTPLVQNPSRPITWWAALGAGVVGIQLYVYLRWIASSNFTRVNSGPDSIPLWMRVVAHSAEIGSWMLLIFGLYRYIYRPWRESRHLAPLGMIWLSAITIYWLDWSTNWLAPIGNWSGAFWFNRGSWYNFIPGWVSPNGSKVAELNTFGLPIVVAWCGIGAMALCGIMRMAKRRWPTLSNSTLLMLGFGAAFILDIIVESLFIRAGLYTYSGSIPAVTLWAGHYYQFPIYEALLMAPMWGMMAALLFFTDDHGRTWAERGIDRLRLSRRKAAGVRWLAFAGFLNLLMILYTFGWIFVTAQPSFQWTRDTVGKRSYLIQGICGPGTKVACPADGSPMPRGDGKTHVDPAGNVVENGKIVGRVILKYN